MSNSTNFLGNQPPKGCMKINFHQYLITPKECYKTIFCKCKTNIKEHQQALKKTSESRFIVSKDIKRLKKLEIRKKQMNKIVLGTHKT